MPFSTDILPVNIQQLQASTKFQTWAYVGERTWPQKEGTKREKDENFKGKERELCS